MDNKFIRQFLTGSWNTFSIVELHQDKEEFTPALFAHSLEVFKDDYDVISLKINVWEDLICSFIHLKEKEVKSKKRKLPANTERKPKELKFKFAFSPKNAILFCNRNIPIKVRELICRGINAEDLAQIELSGSCPLDLLIFHRQSIKSEDKNELLCSKYASQEMDEDSIPRQIGPNTLRLPKIRRLTADIENVPIDDEDDQFEGCTMKKVRVEINSPSIFDLYRDLYNSGVIYSVPPWIAACKATGKTHKKVIYETEDG